MNGIAVPEFLPLDEIEAFDGWAPALDATLNSWCFPCYPATS